MDTQKFASYALAGVIALTLGAFGAAYFPGFRLIAALAMIVVAIVAGGAVAARPGRPKRTIVAIGIVAVAAAMFWIHVAVGAGGEPADTHQSPSGDLARNDASSPAPSVSAPAVPSPRPEAIPSPFTVAGPRFTLNPQGSGVTGEITVDGHESGQVTLTCSASGGAVKLFKHGDYQSSKSGAVGGWTITSTDQSLSEVGPGFQFWFSQTGQSVTCSVG